jgi:hypothetical protein
MSEAAPKRSPRSEFLVALKQGLENLVSNPQLIVCHPLPHA